MAGHKINRLSSALLLVLSFVAMGTVFTGYFQAPQPDEGTAAHLFQLSIVAFVPTLVIFLASADWKAGFRSLRVPAYSAATLAVAFGALYYLEHFYR